MTPKEEAVRLVGKFYKITKQEGYYEEFQEAKECALISIDRTLESLNNIEGQHSTIYEEEDYLKEVKQEIKKIITL